MLIYTQTFSNMPDLAVKVLKVPARRDSLRKCLIFGLFLRLSA
jgi:hypothetical protein